MLHDLELYKEYYDGMPYQANAQWALILSDEPTTIRELEKLLKMTQDEAVDNFIETSCWADDLPRLVGKKGTPGERLRALRRVYLKSAAPSLQTDYTLLTPLEHDLFMTLFKLEEVCTDPALKKRAKAGIEAAGRIADKAKSRYQKEYEALRAEARK
jgi:hypothetical protein